ncbi:helix-hairpin-helix domain-containing protein [Desulforhopalus sp. IMCC35007]|uniref:helix-hairpin-helix domain-containing protein n=1 Tax=Desulforhopalus sp. IMCC35007 TaxID=2569543 RepID=UPI00145CCDDD|nr:helix-hairpin-helix domain-containing protein [Desulforhopalus sp. IMCC35007]
MAIPITAVSGIGAHTAEILVENGFESAEALAAAPKEDLMKIKGFGQSRAEKVIASARALVAVTDLSQEQDLQPTFEAEVKEEQVTEKKIKKKKKAKKKSPGPKAFDPTLIKKSKSRKKGKKKESGAEGVEGEKKKKKKKKKKKDKESGKKKSN